MVDGMSIREASGVFGLHRDTVRKMLAHSVPPGYRRRKPPTRPKIGPYTGVIDRILEDDPVSSTGQALNLPKKQRHTAKRIHERLRDEYGFDGGYTIVKDYVRKHRRRTREMFVPLVHPPGHAQCDFGEAWAVIGGVKQKIHFFVLDPWTDQVYEWLTADRLQVTRIHELLAGRGCRVSYTSSRRFISDGLAEAKSGDCPDGLSAPGEVAEMDFGRLGLIEDRGPGDGPPPGGLSADHRPNLLSAQLSSGRSSDRSLSM